MKQIVTEIFIEAPPERVWSVLTDFARYPEWNPFLRRVEGRALAGARLRVEIHPPGGRPVAFRPRVLAAEPGRELRWLGRVLLPGLFDGEHTFALEPTGEGRTQLRHFERLRACWSRWCGGAWGNQPGGDSK